MARGKPPVSGSGCWGRVDPNLRAPQALCICPTRELALQNLEIIEKIGKYTGIKVECAVPSIRDKTSSCAVPIHSRAPVSAQIVIGTPGTIKKLMSYKKLGVTCVKVLVFDEADQMLAAVNLVVNYDLPIKHEPSHGKRELPEPDYELYLHRCGWTGRFGAKGAVINLLCLDWDHLLMENIEKYYNIQVPEVKICEEAFENALRAAGLL